MMYGSREVLFMVLSSLYEVAIPIFNLYLLANISLIAPMSSLYHILLTYISASHNRIFTSLSSLYRISIIKWGAVILNIFPSLRSSSYFAVFKISVIAFISSFLIVRKAVSVLSEIFLRQYFLLSSARSQVRTLHRRSAYALFRTSWTKA